MSTQASQAQALPVKLDIGCGNNKQGPDWTGIDIIKFPNVDLVCDVRVGLPYGDDSVDEVYTSHFVEHLTATQRCHFFNECYRVMKKGAKLTMIVPHWSNARAYGDPTHMWPPITEWFFFYLSKDWRSSNAPHTDKANWPDGYDCDFDCTWGNSYRQDPDFLGRSEQYKRFAMANFRDTMVDIHVTMVPKKA